jgi:hypothetical protein
MTSLRLNATPRAGSGPIRPRQAYNWPAHRLVYAYANLLPLKHPRKADTWFTAMVYFSPAELGLFEKPDALEKWAKGDTD